jgi:NADPH:quinone reductase-like Zn-dependent oxidoreductase
VRWVSASNDYLRTGADRARALATILEAVAAGRFDARIAGRFELARAAEAHERLASRRRPRKAAPAGLTIRTRGQLPTRVLVSP